MYLGINSVYEVNRQLKLSIQDNFSDSLPYMAPETYFSKAGDVWSLGILLHEMLTGEFPTIDKERSNSMIIKETEIHDLAVSVLKRIFVRDPLKRIKIDEILTELVHLHDTDLWITTELGP